MVLKSAGTGSGSQAAASVSGLATLVGNPSGSTVTVSTTSITALSRFRSLVSQNLSGVVVPSSLGVSGRVPGVSFTILADQLTDTSVVYWEFFEP